jgi:polyferredoxin/formate hydrogenlyase subunit 6/NADH:ubiquinone oxidoreductase subunit I
MRIVTVRRISQTFFLLLFLWFCVVSSFGMEWWQLRGWPVNWFLQLDPMVALGTILTTGTLYAGLLWALVTVVLTILLGRFFCGWLCPFGTMHQLAGFLGKWAKSASYKVGINQYHHCHSIKYDILLFLLAAAAGTLLAESIRIVFTNPIIHWILLAATVGLAAFAVFKSFWDGRQAASIGFALIAVWAVLAFFFGAGQMLAGSLQTGLLDPIPLVSRSVNLTLISLADANPQRLSGSQRYYEGVWVIGIIFLAAVLLNLRRPRFYCRFLCPLGALLGLLGRFSLWKITKKVDDCRHCKLCEVNCEGGCEPAAAIRTNECVLCMNCLQECRHGLITFGTQPSSSGEIASPELSRREVMTTLLSGVAVLPMLGLSGSTRQNYNPSVIRPPGALTEADFLRRCLKCGQCMRICPTNIIQPAGMEAGVEGLWTPILNFRIGTSGCQLNCVACSFLCPTAAIRPLSLDEKRGLNDFASRGPIRIGTAFVDTGRCLPWAMDKPCIVCQENCPVSPKAIFVREFFSTIRGGLLEVKRADALTAEFRNAALTPDQLATGDYYLRCIEPGERDRRSIVGNTVDHVTVRQDQPFLQPLEAGAKFEIQVRLQRPQVDVKRCIGCGICEHECPVSGLRAIRVTAENETRNRSRSLLL